MSSVSSLILNGGGGGALYIETVTGNSGGPVPPESVTGNINIVGDGTTVTVVGDPGTNTLTISATGGGGGGITTINGDAGSVTGTTVTFTGGVAPYPASGIFYTGAGTDMTTTVNWIDMPYTGIGSGQYGIQGYISAQGSPFFYWPNFGQGNFFISDANPNVTFTGSGALCFGGGAGANMGNGGSSPSQNILIGSGAGNAIVTSTRTSIGNAVGYNTAVGSFSLQSLIDGHDNLILGSAGGVGSGSAYTGSESSNICLQNVGVAAENNVIRIGTTGTGDGQQSSCFIAGISGVTVTGVAVLVDGSDQLGVAVSSRKYKKNIEDMGSESDKVLNLRPVTFSYKEDETNSKIYGLIAEEVAEIMPELVAYDKSGDPQTVKYHELPSILLNEIIKLRKELNDLKVKLAIN